MALLGTSGKAGLRTLRQKGASQWNLSRFQLRFLSSTSTKSENLLNLLRATGVSSVAEEYLNGFEKIKGSSPAFAVIKVGGEVVEYELETLVKTCSILHSMNLQPIVIHGGGPQMNDELKARGVEPNYIGGHRVTDEATLDVAKTIFTDLNNRVVDAFRKEGTKAKGFPSGIFNAVISNPDLGFVGEITSVNTSEVEDCLKSGSIPVLTSLGFDGESTLNINADVAAREMAIALKPARIVFTSAKGGWIDDDSNELVNAIDLMNEYDGLANRDYTGRQGTLLKLNEIKLLLDNLPQYSSVAITAADSILKELFTNSGGGTMFIKGEPINVFTSIGQLDLNHLKGLLGNRITDSYFENLQATADKVYTYGSASYSAVAVVSKIPVDASGDEYVPFLELLHVDPKSQGLGRENLMLKKIKDDYPGLVWCQNNFDNASRLAAESFADGLAKTSDKKTFAWYGNIDYKAAMASKYLNDAGHATPKTEDMGKVSAWSSESTPSSNLIPSSSRVKVGLLGARGYVGREFAKLLIQHPDLELTSASSRALTGMRVIDSFGLDESAATHGIASDLCFETVEPEDFANLSASGEVELWVLALPNGLAPRFLEPLEKTPRLMIDLGADFRFDDGWTYGLPERPGAREKLSQATKISNPGCYATGAQVGLMPLLQPKDKDPSIRLKDIVPSVFGVSGYSGAGTSPSPKNDPKCLNDNLMPYALTNHIHEREATRHLGAQIAFMPHVAPYFQGISLTITSYLEPKQSGEYPTAEEVAEYFAQYYENEPLIQVNRDPADIPNVRDVMFKHHVVLGGFNVDPQTGRLVTISLIDNLLKGAATQALQNINIALGYDELKGIA